MSVHHHRLKRVAIKHAKQLRAKGYNVTLVQYSDGSYAVYAYRN